VDRAVTVGRAEGFSDAVECLVIGTVFYDVELFDVTCKEVAFNRFIIKLSAPVSIKYAFDFVCAEIGAHCVEGCALESGNGREVRLWGTRSVID
jgi:hypothetical protein